MAATTDLDQSAALWQISVDAPRFSGYTPLETIRRDIRVLDIDSSLHCCLRIVSLDENPSYSALSYYWGSPSATIALVVNGENVQLRRTSISP